MVSIWLKKMINAFDDENIFILLVEYFNNFNDNYFDGVDGFKDFLKRNRYMFMPLSSINLFLNFLNFLDKKNRYEKDSIRQAAIAACDFASLDADIYPMELIKKIKKLLDKKTHNVIIANRVVGFYYESQSFAQYIPIEDIRRNYFKGNGSDNFDGYEVVLSSNKDRWQGRGFFEAVPLKNYA